MHHFTAFGHNIACAELCFPDNGRPVDRDEIYCHLVSSCKHGSNLLSFSKIQPVKTVSTIRGWISNSFTLVMVPERTPHVQDRHNWSQPINNKKASHKKVNNWTLHINQWTILPPWQTSISLTLHCSTPVIDVVLCIQVVQSRGLHLWFIE